MALSGTDCDEALRDLEAYLDGELPSERARVVERHLADCAPCLGRGEFARRLHVLVRVKCGQAVAMPAGLDERVRRLIGPSGGD